MPRKKRIAILEDDDNYREILTERLSGEGYEVIGAASGFDIVREVMTKNPDLIIVDLVLPDVAGNKVIEMFNKKDVIKNVPVIVISSKDKQEIKSAAKEIKAVSWLQKPVDMDNLVTLIKNNI
ncbi:MAG: response regulator [Elusimicrobia bacterium]|nr:response regulator [Elusimicrobiota bacterium]